jgi:hypothetical protein
LWTLWATLSAGIIKPQVIVSEQITAFFTGKKKTKDSLPLLLDCLTQLNMHFVTISRVNMGLMTLWCTLELGWMNNFSVKLMCWFLYYQILLPSWPVQILCEAAHRKTHKDTI